MSSHTNGPLTRSAGAGCADAAPLAITAAPTAACVSTLRRVGASSWMAIASSHVCLELHLLQHRRAQKAQRIADHLGHLEVIVAFADQQADRLAGLLHGLGELAVLPLKLRRLEGAVGHDHR